MLVIGGPQTATDWCGVIMVIEGRERLLKHPLRGAVPHPVLYLEVTQADVLEDNRPEHSPVVQSQQAPNAIDLSDRVDLTLRQTGSGGWTTRHPDGIAGGPAAGDRAVIEKPFRRVSHPLGDYLPLLELGQGIAPASATDDAATAADVGIIPVLDLDQGRAAPGNQASRSIETQAGSEVGTGLGLVGRG